MDQHELERLDSVVEHHRFSLGVIRGLIEKHAEATYATFDGRCAPEDLHGGFVASNMRQNLWVDLQRHARDPRGATLHARTRRQVKLDFLEITDGADVTMRLRKHPRRLHSARLEPVSAEQSRLDFDLFGKPSYAPLYVLYDVDLGTQSSAGVWLAAVSDFDRDLHRVIHGRVALPPAPAVLLPGNIEPLRPVDAASLDFDGLLDDQDESEQGPA